MKRKLLLVMIAVSFAISLFAQTRFDNGFRDGYKEGYCHDKGISCIPPIPPIPPIPQIGENSASYQDGYNRGFKMGTQANASSNQNSTRQRYSTSKPEFVDDFIYKPPYEAMERALQKRQDKYDLNF